MGENFRCVLYRDWFDTICTYIIYTAYNNTILGTIYNATKKNK